MASSERICNKDRVRVYNNNRETHAVEFFKKCADIHNNKYDYTASIYRGAHQKISIICKIHGAFDQIANDHKNGSGCKKCSFAASAEEKEIAKNQFILKATAKHINEYDYTHINYVNSHTPVTITCIKHNHMFKQTPSNHLQGKGYGCKLCNKERKQDTLCSTAADFINKARHIHGSKYIYANINYINSKEPVDIICPHHGIFNIIPNSHLNGSGCSKCGLIQQSLTKINNSAESFYNRIKEKHPNIKILEEYTGMFNNISFECDKHGIQQTTSINLLNRSFACSKCSKKFSIPEQKLTNLFKKCNIQIIHCYKIPGTKMEIDIYLPDYNLGIEVNGIYYHCERGGRRGKLYHVNKLNLCNDAGIRLLQFTDDEINEKYHIVASKIMSTLKLYEQRIFAKQTQIKSITSIEKQAFLNSYHMQGDDKSSIYYGLFYSNELVSVMTFGMRKITRGTAEYELMRYACKCNMQIVGGFSRLLKHFVKSNNNVNRIKTYADRRYSMGDVYNNAGFVFSHVSQPSYWYFKLPSTKLQHRFNFAKHKLQKKLAEYDEHKSEWENMKNNGYDRIWDCGTLVYYMNI